MMCVINRKKDILEYVKELKRSYGSVVKLWFGHKLIVVLTNPRDIQIIFNSSKTLSKPAVYNPASLVFGKSLLTTSTVEWNKFRRILNPSFAHHVIDNYVSIFCQKSQMMADRLEEHSNKEPIRIIDYTKLCTLDMVTETSLGVPADVQKEDQKHCIIKSSSNLFRVLFKFFIKPWFWFIPLAKTTQTYTKVVELVKPIHDYIDSIVSEKTRLYFDSLRECRQIKTVAKNRSCLLEHMVTTMVNNPGLFTAEELRNQALFIMFAGTDTTALATTYVLMLMGLHPDVQTKVVREQQDIFGEDVHRPVTARDLKQMVYLDQVISETLRLYPVAPLVARRADEDVRISEYILPAGTTIIIPIYIVHRDPAFYPDPDKFNPERFNNQGNVDRHLCSFIPFLAGRRMCLGKRYACVALKTMLSVLLRRYEVLECGSTASMECVQFEYLLKMVNGYNIKLVPRKKNCES
ncbi:cytochrome P450 4d2-like [Bacillus rossius redtenbacheri]|uniref:cytochrome P450 4d2-like n=1 Tax=Bacillus rossius redtenbacheri TaxID=93214 RepID=UPI002FDCE233